VWQKTGPELLCSYAVSALKAKVQNKLTGKKQLCVCEKKNFFSPLIIFACAKNALTRPPSPFSLKNTVIFMSLKKRLEKRLFFYEQIVTSFHNKRLTPTHAGNRSACLATAKKKQCFDFLFPQLAHTRAQIKTTA
jgi:hypothetical protein